MPKRADKLRLSISRVTLPVEPFLTSSCRRSLARHLGLQADQRIDDKGRREPEEDALICDLLEREVTTPEADEATCRRYYVNNQRRSYSPELFEAAHVLFSVSPDDIEATIRRLPRYRTTPVLSPTWRVGCRPATRHRTTADWDRSRAATRCPSLRPFCSASKRVNSARCRCARVTGFTCRGWIAASRAGSCPLKSCTSASLITCRPRAGSGRSLSTSASLPAKPKSTGSTWRAPRHHWCSEELERGHAALPSKTSLFFRARKHAGGKRQRRSS